MGNHQSRDSCQIKTERFAVLLSCAPTRIKRETNEQFYTLEQSLSRPRQHPFKTFSRIDRLIKCSAPKSSVRPSKLIWSICKVIRSMSHR